jgi:RNase P subunit RPR2
MAESITECDKCKSRNFTELNPEARHNPIKITVWINAKCNDCGHEFEFPTFSDKGKEMRRKGQIW